jgi:hypothetical protein
MIHCIGDSHISVFTGYDEMPPIWNHLSRSNDRTDYFRSYRIGPATATGLGSKISIIDDIIIRGPVDKEKDIILFCFGEVDIRAHLSREYLEKNKDIDELIKFSVDEYMRIVLLYKSRGYNVMIWSPIASFSDDKPYTTGPFFGSCSERNFVTRKFNNYLETLCKENNIEFISIFEDMLLDGEKTNPIYLDNWDGCHIHLIQTSFPLIVKKFKEKGLI